MKRQTIFYVSNELFSNQSKDIIAVPPLSSEDNSTNTGTLGILPSGLIKFGKEQFRRGRVNMKAHLDSFLVEREQSAKSQLGDGEGKSTRPNSQSAEQAHIFELETEKVIIDDLLKPLLFVLKYTLPFHNTIEYDAVARCCVYVKGSCWRKICCVIWELLILFRLGIKAIPSLNSDFLSAPAADKAGISIVAQGAQIVFIVFGVASFYIFWFKTKCMCDILNCALHVAKKIHLKEASPPRTNLMKYVTRASWIFVICYVIMTIIMHTIQTFSSSASNSSNHLQDLNSSRKGDNGKYRLDFTGVHLTYDSAFLKGLTVVANILNIAWWMMVFFHLTAWAIFFRQLVTIFYWRIQAKHELGHYIIIPHEIRTFNKISTVIDKFNQVYGLLILFGAVVVVTYISLSIKHVFIGMQHFLDMSSGLHLCLSYVPMAVGSIMLAEVPRVAGTFAGVIKDEFGNFTRECGDPAESLCGIAIVHFDLTTSNIGVKGLGFFTVSYQFITTTVSVIISYSILMAQLFPKENVAVDV